MVSSQGKNVWFVTLGITHRDTKFCPGLKNADIRGHQESTSTQIRKKSQYVRTLFEEKASVVIEYNKNQRLKF